MTSMKIIHSADWQLGKPFGRFPQDVRSALSEARLDAIDRVGEAAVASRAAHVLVAGDVFDNVDPGDRVVMQALSRMAPKPVSWLLMPGNHDHARAGGLWSRVRMHAPANVRVVDTPEPLALEQDAWLLPAPLEHRKTTSDPTNAMVDMATPPGALRIGLAHGSIREFGTQGESQNLIPPDRAKTAGLDYLALGDWHGFLTVGDRTAYSGTPEVDRFGREEAGSCVAVEVRPGEAPRIQLVETGRYRWLSRQWDVAGTPDLEREMEALRRTARPADILLSLRLTGVATLGERVAMLAGMEQRLAHELRHLDLNAEGLRARPTAEDVASIDVHGALAVAAAALDARVQAGGADAALAAAALERLYVETLRLDREATR